MSVDSRRLGSNPRGAAAPRAEKDVRLDIQLLRAVAVGSVLLYHLWPTRMPGGFIGVDVFFVISGFLITSHLLRSAQSESGIRPGRFWANRARRLLPLASVVLVATIAASLMFMPASTWIPSLRNVIASALYVENWLLARDSVDYLARDQTPAPTQHFWSLSAEEQFYIVWPLLIMAAIVIALKVNARRNPFTRASVARLASLAAVSVVLTVSLTYSLWMTSASPSVAYFATTTRAWEFAAGGIVAFLGHQGSAGTAAPEIVWWWLRFVASWLGAALIVASTFLITETTPFPGTAALFPVVGAAFFIWAGDTRTAFAPTVLAQVRPLTYVGDISYGIYLWHWPLIVITPFAIGVTALNTFDKITIIGVSVILAAISKVLVEDPFRYRKFWTATTRRGFYPGIAGMVTVCLVATGSIAFIQHSAPPTATADALPEAALTAPTDPTAPLIPSIATRSTDYGQMFECFDFDKSGPHECSYGSPDASVSIAIVGDSHAAHFIPALIDAANANHWRLTTIVGMSCDGGLSSACGGGQQGFNDIVAANYDLVLTSAYRASLSAYPDVVEYLTKLHEAGVKLLPIADVPFHPKSTYACIDASDGDPTEAAACTTPATAALQEVPDRIAPIADSLGIDYVDLTDIFCEESACNSVIGNVVVYQDAPSSHLTATFSRLLSPRLAEAIRAALAATG